MSPVCLFILGRMLRLQPYRETLSESVNVVFKTIFDESETAYLDKVKVSGLSFVAKDRKGLVQAFILVQESPAGFTDFEIAFLGVSPRYRRKGYAERLISMCIDAAKGRGIWLNVMKTNVVACALYSKMGFEIGAESEEGLTYVYGVKYECSCCKAVLGPAAVQWTVGHVPHCKGCLTTTS